MKAPHLSSVKSAPITHTQQPMVTGTSVIGIKYNGGVMLSADTLASYGSMARYKDMERLKAFGDNTVVGCSGDISDMQYLHNELDDIMVDDFETDDGNKRSPSEIHSYLSRVLYNRRCKFDPLWNSCVVAGFRDGQSFLGLVDLVGTTYKDDVLATGFGGHLAIPLLRKARDQHGDNMTREQARQVIEDCMRVLFYRDCRALNKIQIADMSAEGVSVSEPFILDTFWEHTSFKRGAKPGTGAW